MKPVDIFSRIFEAGYLPFVVFLIGLTLSYVGFSVVKMLEEQKFEQTLLSDAQSQVRSIEEELEIVLEVLRVLKSHFVASPRVDRRDFNIFVGDMLGRHPDIQALEWVPKVERSEMTSFIDAAQRDGFSDFSITERSPDDTTVQVGMRDTYFPVYFLEPLSGNESVLGYDSGSNAVRSEALNMAAASGEIVATARMSLVRESQNHAAILFFNPVYEKAHSTSGVSGSGEEVEGFVVMVLRVGDAIAQALLHEADNAEVHVEDITDAENPENLYGTGPQSAQHEQRYSYSHVLEIGGRQWRISANARVEAYPDGFSWLPQLVLAAGFLFAGFASVLVFVLLSRRRVIEALVEVRTAEVRQLHQRQDQIFEHAGDGVYALGADGRTSFANKAAIRMLGYSLEELEGKPEHDLIHHHYPDGRDFPKEACKIQETLTRGSENKEDGEVFWRKDGSSFPVEYASSPVSDEGGNLTGAVVVFRDITERKIREAQAALIQKVAIISNEAMGPDELFDRALPVIGEFIGWPVAGVLYVGDEGDDLIPSGCWYVSEDMTEQMRGLPSRSDALIREKGATAVRSALKRREPIWVSGFADHPELTRGELLLRHGLNSGFGFPIFSNRGVWAVVEFFNTASLQQDDNILFLMETLGVQLARALERMSAEQELMQANQVLEQTNAELDTFAYVASHDLRAPLRGMDTVAKWIEQDLDGGDKDDIRTNLGLLRGRVVRMENLLADILSYARAGKRESEPEMVDVGEMLRELVKWADAPSGFEIKLQAELPTFFISRTLLEQVFMNLISNGIKHHDRAAGVIEILYKVEDGYHVFIVRDDGPGIPPQFHDRVFTMFKTLKPRDDVEGSGIGLAIVKKMIVISLGLVHIESPLTDRGCEVHVKLPVSSSKN